MMLFLPILITSAVLLNTVNCLKDLEYTGKKQNSPPPPPPKYDTKLGNSYSPPPPPPHYDAKLGKSNSPPESPPKPSAAATKSSAPTTSTNPHYEIPKQPPPPGSPPPNYGGSVKQLGETVGISTIVSTSYGDVRGIIRHSRIGNEYYDFRGIPYAAPPIGPLRFEPPEPHPGWQGVLDCTEYRSYCLQTVFSKIATGDESCLFLNIFTRTLDPKSSPRPVMFWIHGGLYMGGSSSIYPPKYFMDEEVVLVTINYRLSSFGFLNTGDGVVKGNMGLKDQNLALRWTKQNIRNFNGDPERIIIFGESAGSASVHFQVLSPQSMGLFWGAIMQSGTSLAPWAMVHDPAYQAMYLAERLGCTTADTHSMVTCLKAQPARKIANLDGDSIEKFAEGKPSLFAPTVELRGPNAFIDKKPLEILKSGNFSKTPLIMGVNTGEGLVYLVGVMRNEKFKDYANENWESICIKQFRLNGTGDGAKYYKEMMEMYMPSGAKLVRKHLIEPETMTSDRGFYLDNHDVAVMHSQHQPVYAYLYSYLGIFSIADLLLTKLDVPFLYSDVNYAVGSGINYAAANVGNKRSTNDLGVSHADELLLLFNVPLLRKEIVRGDADLPFSEKFVALWSSFAEKGKPDVSKMNVTGFEWEAVRNAKDEALTRLEIGDNVTLVKEPFFSRLKFWKDRNLAYL